MVVTPQDKQAYDEFKQQIQDAIAEASEGINALVEKFGPALANTAGALERVLRSSSLEEAKRIAKEALDVSAR